MRPLLIISVVSLVLGAPFSAAAQTGDVTPVDPTIVEVRVSAGSDDAEERASGSITTSSSDLEMVQERTTQTVGIRFRGVTIPQGATITSAYLQFQADETDSTSTSLDIQGQAADDAPGFASQSFNISSRATTAASVIWSPPAWNSRGQEGLAQRTPDLQTVVQEIVDREGWAATNSMVFIITGSGKRVAESYNGRSSGAPLLHVEYLEAPSAATFHSIAALDAVKGEGDTGSTAFTFTVMRTGETGEASNVDYAVTGGGGAPANGADFGGVLPSGSVSFAAAETTKTVTVEVSGDTDIEGDEGFTVTLSNPSAGTAVTTATVDGTIQNDDTPPPPATFYSIAALDAVRVEGDTGSTAFTFTVTRTGVTSGASGVDYAVTGSGGDPANGADFGGVLPSAPLSFAGGDQSKTITVDVSGDIVFEGGEGFTVTLSNSSVGTAITTATADGTIQNDDVASVDPTVVEVRVSAGSDDAEERASGSITTSSSDLEMVQERTTQTVGIRFRGVTIPQGATITSAYLQFQADETDSTATSLDIQGQAADDAPGFASQSFNISSRARTAASVIWSPPAWNSRGQEGLAQRTPDLQTVVQEIVDREGWAATNSMVFIITGSGKRVAESYNGRPTGAPLLHVEYLEGTPPPVVDDQIFAVAENAAAGTAVGTVAAAGPSGPLTFSFAAGNNAGLFEIHAVSGAITTTAPLDHEAAAQHILTVQAADGGTPNLTDTAIVTIDVGDVNEAPVVDDAIFVVTENTPVGTAVGSVAATDPDDPAGSSGRLTFSFVGGNGAGLFEIDPASGAITTTTAQLDHEAAAQHVLTVQATDGGTPNLTDTATLTVDVGDVNEAPVVNNKILTVAENAAAGTAVGAVAATDPDDPATANGTLTFSFAAGNGAGLFALDTASGAITITAPLDHEAAAQHVLTVQAADNGAPFLADTAIVTVDVGDVNETPVVNDQTFAVAENTATGAAVGTVAATDPDDPAGPGGKLTFSFVGGSGASLFAIHAVSGAITTTAPLDHEAAAQHVLTVRATDNVAPSLADTATITIDVGDVNEAPVVDDAIFAVTENTPVGTAVGSVAATDPDDPAGSSGVLTFSFAAGNDAGLFEIDAASGAITTTAPLDHEAAAQHVLTVQSADGDTPNLTDTATITIDVGDVNEAPVVDDAIFAVTENTPVGTAVGSVAATDPDDPAGSSGTLMFSFAAGNDAGLFEIDPASGAITTTTAQLDHEAAAQHVLTVQATDGETPNLTDTATITIDVGDVNEAPVVDDAIFAVTENTAVGTAVGSVAATDPDDPAGSSGVLTFSFAAGNDAGLFEIDPASGAITTTTAQLDHEAAAQHVLTVQATDGGTPNLTDTATITIDVGDVNEAPVIADQNIYIVGIPDIGTIVGTLAASDPDQGDTLTYLKQGGTGSGAFSVEATSGVVSVLDNTLIDFETSPSLTLEVRVLDSAGLSSETAVVTISPPPATIQPRIVEDQGFAINASQPVGRIIGYVATSGPDADDAMTFAITGGTGAGSFAIDPALGAITFTGDSPIDFEATPSLTLDVQVTNSVGLAETATITIRQASAIELATLDGTDGFVLFGADADDNSGFSVSSAGDVNGDGINDLIIGAHYAAGAGNALANSGESYVVFGSDNGFGASLELGSLDGANGFVLYGVDAGDKSGFSVGTAGDFNGDGLDDIVIGAVAAGDTSNSEVGVGESYVVFGRSDGFGASLDLASLDGTNGFVLHGIDGGDGAGFSVSTAGDINGDGLDDIIIGAALADGAGNAAEKAGESYVVFGRTGGIGASLDLDSLDGTNGFVLYGIDPDDAAGAAVSAAGDVNGDGFDDIIIGARYNGLAPAGDEPGEAYVVFGRAGGFGASMELASLDGTNGFVLRGVDDEDSAGVSVSAAGDVNGDGLADIIIGAYVAHGPRNLLPVTGESYVVFGRTDGFGASFDLATLDGVNGFKLNGVGPLDASGISVSSAGDVNGDGIDDIIVGAFNASTSDDNFSGSGTPYVNGESYVVFGHAGSFDMSFNLASIDGTNGLVLKGIDQYDNSGVSVSSAGDLNGDGFGDVVVGALQGSGAGNSVFWSGESYVVYGGDLSGAVTHLGTAGDDILTGTAGDDVVNGAQGDDTLDSLAGNDLLTGASGRDAFVIGDASGGVRTITDYSAQDDNLRLTVLDGAGVTDATLGQFVQIARSGQNTVVRIDTDGSLTGAGFVIVAVLEDFHGASVRLVVDGLVFTEPDDPLGADQTFAVDENAAAGTVIGTVATPGTGSAGALSFEINGGTGATAFAVDAASGQITVADTDQLDFEVMPFLTLRVFVTDGAGVEGTTVVRIDLNDVNEAPVIGDHSFAIAEDSANGSFVGTVAITNPDAGDTVTLTIAGGTGATAFAIDPVSGAITVSDSAQLDFETTPFFTLDILGTDASGLTSTAVVTISPVPAVSPRSIVENQAFAINENPAATGIIGYVATSGPDADDAMTFAITGGTGAGLFAIDPVSGAITFTGNSPIDFAATPSLTLDVQVTNSVGLVETATVTIRQASAIALATLDGTDGFVLFGADAYDNSGYSVSSAGDVNGDGIGDLIVGAPRAAGADNAGIQPGESYVVFGDTNGFGASLDLATLDGTNGFVLHGIDDNDSAGLSVSSAGDVNGDGLDDIIIGAPGGRGADNTGDYVGEAYVVFGRNGGFGPSLDLASLDGTNGFVIHGLDDLDQMGVAVSSVGDINGDGLHDIIISASSGDGAGNAIGEIGESYVIFGRASGFGASFDLASLDGTNGFVLYGIDEFDQSGAAVGAAGDVNGDGFDDIIIGTFFGPPAPAGGEPLVKPGEAYVVFGHAGGFAASMELASLDGTNGFVLRGIDDDDQAGASVSAAGDVNGDGLADILIGAPFANGPRNLVPGTGESYVVFGSTDGFGASFDLASIDGVNGFKLNGVGLYDTSGISVSPAGDVNGDGIDDIIVGASSASTSDDNFSGNQTPYANGESYVVFGHAGTFDMSFNLASIDGTNGLVLKGIDGSDGSGNSVSGAGDLNGDGFGDVIVGAYNAAGAGNTLGGSGESYVVYGGDFSGAVTHLGTAGGDFLTGTPGDDVMNGAQGNDTLDSLAGNDLLTGASGRDAFVIGDASGGVRTITDYSAQDDNLRLTVLDGAGVTDATLGQFVQIARSGQNTVVRIDTDGSLTGAGFVIVAVLEDFHGASVRLVVDGLVFTEPDDPLGADQILAVDENAAAGTVIGTVATPGIGFAGALTFEIIGGTGATAFAVDAASGQITVADTDQLDFEMTQLFTLRVLVTDSVGVEGTTVVEIELNDVNDAPVIGDHSFAIAENAPAGTVVGTVTATDQDIGDTVTFAITGGTGATVFMIDPASGQVTVLDASQLDFETTPSITLDVSVTDSTGLPDATVVTIDLSNVNDAPRVILPGPQAVDEDTTSQIFGISLADDEAINDPAAIYTLTLSSDFGTMSVVPAGSTAELVLTENLAELSGTLADLNATLVNGVSFTGFPNRNNDDDGPGILTVTINDGSAIDTQQLTINLISVNDAPVVMDQTFVASPGVANGDFIGTVVFADLDTTDTASFSVTGGTGATAFALDALSGELTVADSTQIDFGTAQSFILDVKVTDSGGSTDTAVVKIVNHAIGIDLAALDGTNGFVVRGIDFNDILGGAVSSAGDVNGDGFDDIIVGAINAGGAGNVIFKSGETYVVFGRPDGFDPIFDLTSLDGTNGFMVRGIDAFDRSGAAVSSAGDVNGDGLDDFIISGQPSGGAREIYVVLGRTEWPSGVLNLDTLDGTNGFILNGIDLNDAAGASVGSAGDVNGDGLDDIIVGAPFASGADNDLIRVGESYVIFGDAGGFAASIDLSTLDGTNGFVLYGTDSNDWSGATVSSAGDLNNDGLNDVIIGAPGANAFGGPNSSGESYVVFGHAGGFGASLDLNSLDGTNGFALHGINNTEFSRYSASSVGDVNDDGMDDIVIGFSRGGSAGNVLPSAGQSYVVYGRSSGFGISFDHSTLDGTDGFVLNGIDRSDLSGVPVRAAGDVNGDGVGDIIIGASYADGAGNATISSGESYVVFGRAGGFGSSFDLSSIDGTNGLYLSGIDAYDRSGGAVSAAGDVNGDGFDDVVIGARDASGANGQVKSGEIYVVYGANFSGAVTHLGTIDDDTLTGTTGDDVMNGAQGNDTLDAGAGNDLLTGASGDDVFVLRDGAGADEITDFEIGGDVIDVTAFGIDFATLIAGATDVGNGVRIQLDADDSVLLVGVTAGDLSQNDFLN